jgi:hypothetical protein
MVDRLPRYQVEEDTKTLTKFSADSFKEVNFTTSDL